MRFITAAILLASLCGFRWTAGAQGEDRETGETGRARVFGIDVVALIDSGKEIEGRIDFHHNHGKFTYLFSSQTNLDAFRAAPEKYEIQQNGACGRMGPLSGEGSPKLFAVHEKRLYLFASEQCRRSFVNDPAALLEVDEPAPATTEKLLLRGKHLAERAVDALGGDAKLASLVSYRQQLSRTETSGGTDYLVTDTQVFLFPDQVRTDICWNDGCWGNVANRTRGWVVSRGKPDEAMVESQRIAVWRGDGRHPLALLRARSAKGVILTSDESTRTLTIPGEGDVSLDLLHVYSEKSDTVLGVDRDGRVRTMTFKGRGPTLAIGTIERRYSDFHVLSGVPLPARVETLFNGQPVPEQSGTYSVQTIDDPADRPLFEPSPQGKPAKTTPDQ